MRRLMASLVTVPWVVAGSLAAHQLAYRLVAHGHAEAERLLDETGHGYLEHLPIILASCLVLTLVGLAAQAAAAARRRGPCTPPAVWFGLAAPAAFVVQEHLERLVHDGVLPLDAVTEPTFAVGLLIQIPFGLVAWWLARLVLRWVPRLVQAIRRAAWRMPLAAPPRVTRSAVPRRRPRRVVLAGCAAGRAPPLPLSHR